MSILSRWSGEYLSDYSHAADTFNGGKGNYWGSPKYKWLFHVNFEVKDSFFGKNGNIGITVKTVKLPSFQVMTDTLNQYNRPRIVQKKIKYSQVSMTFHDDYAGVSRALWSRYYKYYFSDSVSAKADNNSRNIYNSDIPLGWGLTGPSKPFIQNIKIYSMFSAGTDKKWHSYELINPAITQWEHDSHAYAEPIGIMENKMSMEYESVVYASGSGTPPGYVV